MISESLIPDAALERSGLLELVEAMRKELGDNGNYKEEEDMILINNENMATYADCSTMKLEDIIIDSNKNHDSVNEAAYDNNINAAGDHDMVLYEEQQLDYNNHQEAEEMMQLQMVLPSEHTEKDQDAAWTKYFEDQIDYNAEDQQDEMLMLTNSNKNSISGGGTGDPDMLRLLFEDEQEGNNINNNQLPEMMQMLQMEINNDNNNNNSHNNQEVVLYEDHQAAGNNYINNNYNQDANPNPNPNPNPRKRNRAPRSVWSPEEHEQFLIGFLKHGNNWQAIAQHYVPSRSNIQIASHAQKYLSRKQQQARSGAVGPQASTSNAKPRKKRVSIHDTPAPLV